MKVTDAILAIISAGRTEGSSYFLPPGQLDRDTYLAVNKVLKAAGGKWNRGAKAHVFDGDAAEMIDPIMLTGEITDRKQEFGQFDTPPALAERVCAVAGVRAGKDVLEPSAGYGNIVITALKRGATVTAFEIDNRRLRFMADTVAGLPASAAQRFVGAEADFLTINPKPAFDMVVMNPPFARQADIEHVSHAYRFLKPGGTLVSIMSAGAMFRQDRRTRGFRSLVEESRGKFYEVEPDAFKSAGTGVRTCIVALVA